MTGIDWDRINRMLGEECDGPHGYRGEVYRLDYPGGHHMWLCQSCWVRHWKQLCCPPVTPR